MFNKIIFRLLGSSLIIGGIGIFFNPRHYSSKYRMIIDYNGINILLGLFMVALGVLFIWSTCRGKT